MSTKRRNPWIKFRLGNGLRGYVHFKARTVADAWQRGCASFNQWCPSKNGRMVYLDQEGSGDIEYTTRHVLSELRKKPADRYSSNMTKEFACKFTFWATVAYGRSNQKLVRPDWKRVPNIST